MAHLLSKAKEAPRLYFVDYMEPYRSYAAKVDAQGGRKQHAGRLLLYKRCPLRDLRSSVCLRSILSLAFVAVPRMKALLPSVRIVLCRSSSRCCLLKRSLLARGKRVGGGGLIMNTSCAGTTGIWSPWPSSCGTRTTAAPTARRLCIRPPPHTQRQAFRTCHERVALRTLVQGWLVRPQVRLLGVQQGECRF